MKPFFANSDTLDYAVLRPLSHMRVNWELTWDHEKQLYASEDDSSAASLNQLIEDLGLCSPPSRYHDNEDRLAEFVRDGPLGWPIRKVGGRWVGADYASILEQGGFEDLDEADLVSAAAGRIKAARTRGQTHFDDMEESHRHMLGAILSIILYHRESYEV